MNMWKDYLSGYLKNNRSSGLSVKIAAFISALLLSLLCGLFYNLWKYEIERIVLEEGGWHSRIVGEFQTEEISFIKNFATVKEIEIKQEEQDGEKTVIDITFAPMRAVLEDMPKIAEKTGISPEAITYNYELLAMYLIRSPQDTAPRLLFPLFLLIMLLASFSLIVIIHNAFAVSMNARIHQFGIFSSIGATPKQIRTCFLQEASVLCAMPVLAGNLLGIAITRGLLKMSNALLGSSVPGRHEAVFAYHPLVLGATLLVTAITVWISAWLPAGKLSRMTPLEAIRGTGELQLMRRKKSYILALLFGVEGELAGNALKAQKKALRMTSLSLMLSFMAFTLMQCFFATSEISTRETYFERYQDAWDIMVTLRNTEADSFEETEEIQNLPGVESAIIYQKASAKRIITEEQISKELEDLGGFDHAGGDVSRTEQGWMVNAPIVIVDDHSFLDYCEQIGTAPRLDGAVIRNQIRDVTNPDFRHPRYMPYLKTHSAVSELKKPGSEEIRIEIPVLSYTEEVPVLREEYATSDYYELVHFVPVSLWKEIRRAAGRDERDTYIRILCKENVTLNELVTVQNQIRQVLGENYAAEVENRIQEYETNDRQIQGMKAILGGFCVLLAIIGIGNVFSNTLGFVRQRRREFARYMSIGVTPNEIRRMFWIEALALAGRPILITLPVAALAVWYMLKMSYLAVGEFLAEAPLTPVAAFMLSILASVAIAYALGWRNMRRINLTEALKDDTMI